MNQSNSIFQSVPVPQSTIIPPIPEKPPVKDDRKQLPGITPRGSAEWKAYTHNQSATFAKLKELQPKLIAEGLCGDDYWQMIRRSMDIESRTQINAATYARLATSLRAAEESKLLFNNLCDEIRKYLKNDTCFVLSKDRDGKTEMVYIGDRTLNIFSRCQAYAKQSGKVVQFFYKGRRPVEFYPGK